MVFTSALIKRARMVAIVDTPAQLGKVDEPIEADVRQQGREPVFGRLAFARGALDQQPLLQQRFRDQLVMPDADAHARSAKTANRPSLPSNPQPGNIIRWRGLSRLTDIDFGAIIRMKIVGH
jgi:hypothetical protein